MAEPDAELRILLSQPEGVQELMQALRALVRETLPAAEERAHAGWGIFNYYRNGELGYVGGKDGEAVLGLTRGVELDDHEGLLLGTKTAKFMRQLRLAPGAALPTTAIRELLLQAERLNLERGPPEREWRK